MCTKIYTGWRHCLQNRSWVEVIQFENTTFYKTELSVRKKKISLSCHFDAVEVEFGPGLYPINPLLIICSSSSPLLARFKYSALSNSLFFDLNLVDVLNSSLKTENRQNDEENSFDKDLE
jgi:hypothetical protein